MQRMQTAAPLIKVHWSGQIKINLAGEAHPLNQAGLSPEASPPPNKVNALDKPVITKHYFYGGFDEKA